VGEVLTIEFEKPTQSTCECCGGTTTRLTRFVSRDGDAYAVYYATFSDNHPDRSVSMVVSLGEWGEAATPEQRLAFPLVLRAGTENYEVTVVDAETSPWRETTLLGRVLDRAEALAHPWIADVFHITDHVVEEDIVVKRFLDQQAA
jgi:hypothetical protein